MIYAVAGMRDGPAIVPRCDYTGDDATQPRRGDPPLFHLVLIKPTHYADDGFPIRWVKAAIPSDTLACLNGLAEDAARRQVLGPASTSASIRLTRPTSAFARSGSSAQFARGRPGAGRASRGPIEPVPRAVDLARPFLAAGLPVCIGGFHVSGSVAMPPEMAEAQALGISFFAGEAELGRLDQVMRDVWDGALQPVTTT